MKMRVYRVLFSNDEESIWINDPKICTKSYKPEDVKCYHFPAFDENTAITNVKLYLFDKGYSKENTNFLLQSYDDTFGMWENIVQHKYLENGNCLSLDMN